MEAIRAIVADGNLQLQSPIPWPDGTEVAILPACQEAAGEMTPEEIARTLALMDQSEPLQMTDEELMASEAEREARKQWDREHFLERAEKMRRGWE